jgi:SAM-dependent methyltransferase
MEINMNVIEKKNVDYEEYAFQQGRKARNPKKRKMFIEKIPARIKKFEKYFQQAGPYLVPGSMLCLGARTGCEIKAFINCGFEATGIDLYPLDNIVIKADWHDIPFNSATFDNVYTNAIDHCYDAEKLSNEIHRVLKQKGRLYFQTSKKQMLKTKENKKEYITKSSNFLFWEDGIALAEHFIKFGFRIVVNWEEGKWENFILEAV